VLISRADCFIFFFSWLDFAAHRTSFLKKSRFTLCVLVHYYLRVTMDKNIIFIGLAAIPVAMLAIWWLVTKISATTSKRLLPHTLLAFWVSSLIGGCLSYMVGVLMILLFWGVLKQKWAIGCLSGLFIGLMTMAFNNDVLIFVLLLVSGILIGIAWHIFEHKRPHRPQRQQ
jgi:hypothetical protein